MATILIFNDMLVVSYIICVAMMTGFQEFSSKHEELTYFNLLFSSIFNL